MTTILEPETESAEQWLDRINETGAARRGFVIALEARDASVARNAKLQALCDMHNTAMRLRKYGREPEWLGEAFVELRAKYEGGK